jgi:hypothetical protein
VRLAQPAQQGQPAGGAAEAHLDVAGQAHAGTPMWQFAVQRTCSGYWFVVRRDMCHCLCLPRCCSCRRQI